MPANVADFSALNSRVLSCFCSHARPRSFALEQNESRPERGPKDARSKAHDNSGQAQCSAQGCTEDESTSEQSVLRTLAQTARRKALEPQLEERLLWRQMPALHRPVAFVVWVPQVPAR